MEKQETIVINNNSGQGKNAKVPEIIKYFNAGAMMFCFFWCLRYKKWYISLFLFFVPLLAMLFMFLTKSPFISFVLIQAAILIVIWIGAKGNEIAWQNMRYTSVKNFIEMQNRWIIAFYIMTGIILFMQFIILSITSMAMPSMINAAGFNPNSSASLEKVGKDINITGALKATSTIGQAVTMNCALGEKPPYSTTGNSLAEYVSKHMSRVTINGNLVEDTDGVQYAFKGNGGDCSNNDCFVYIDTNGPKGPNEYWVTKNNPQDRIKLQIIREDDCLNIKAPDFIEELSNSRR